MVEHTPDLAAGEECEGEGEAEVWTHSACMNRQDEAFDSSKLLW